MNFNSSKIIHPHLYEYKRLGASYTEEGRHYLEIYQRIIDEEMSDMLDEGFYRRFELGGTEQIHKMNFYENDI